MRFNSLKSRVLSWFIIIVFILLSSFSYALYYFLEQSINLRIETSLYNKANKIKQSIDTQNFANDYNSEFLILKDNKIFYKSQKFNLKNYKSYIKQNKEFFINEIDEYNIEAIYISKFTTPFNGTIILYKQHISNKAEDIEDILLVLNPLLLLFLIIIGNKLIDKVLNPIKTLTATAKQITIKNFTHTIDIPKNNSEIKELIEAFNEMITRLDDGVKTLDRFNSDLSHEINTPLTIIKGELELCLKQKRDEKFYKEAISKALQQTNQIKQLTNSLLTLTKYSKQNITQTFTKVYLDSILLNICDKYQNRLTIKKFESISIEANETLIYLIFSNIIENSIKYTPKDKNIYISLFKAKDKIYFIVEDKGIGIPKYELKNITKKFYKVSKSRNKAIQGFGLGLSIVKNSIELHNGSLQIDSIVNKGTKVTVIF